MLMGPSLQLSKNTSIAEETTSGWNYMCMYMYLHGCVFNDEWSEPTYSQNCTIFLYLCVCLTYSNVLRYFQFNISA